MRSQIATSSLRNSVSRKILHAFTLEGVKLLPNVLRGENVSPEEDTVWLTQTDMAILFDRSRQNISLYILFIFNEKELLKDSVVKKSLITGLGGNIIDTINKIW